jgi:hypothetical protein
MESKHLSILKWTELVRSWRFDPLYNIDDTGLAIDDSIIYSLFAS